MIRDNHEQLTTNRPNAPLDAGCNGLKPMRVAAQSVPRKVAGAIAGMVRDSGCAELHAVGAESVNQTAKAVALAKHFLAGDDIRVVADIDFLTVHINGSARNAMRFSVRRVPD
ncbi:MAG: stage V sporulation protein S [Chloroflexi bacterium]|nr:stage V sporulation protein S [Chloroflexota bacterium]